MSTIPTGSETAPSAERSSGDRRYRWLLPRRAIVLIVADALLWLIALTWATAARFSFDLDQLRPGRLLVAWLIAAGTYLFCGLLGGLYVGRHRLASLEEVRAVAACSVAASLVLFAVASIAPQPRLVPLSAVLAAGAYQMITALGIRYLARLYVDHRRRVRHQRDHKLIIFGAGDAGYQAAKALLEDSSTDLVPVAFIDDDPSKARLRMLGIPVVGDRSKLESTAAEYDADTVLIAIPGSGLGPLAEVADRARSAGLSVRVVPRLSELIQSGVVSTRDIRDLTLADYLSRSEAKLDEASIAGYLEGRSILVTGAGGSIGSVLCEAIMRYEPAEVWMVDHDENALHGLQLRLDGRASLDSPELVLADIRDRDDMFRLMERTRPEVVFHAAAHKHVTFLERFPEQAVRTNVWGTVNMVEAAAAAGVECFVNVSTDKAADPASTLGTTKRIGEMITAFHGSRGRKYVSVRFGNVLGSAGSVIPVFREQVASGRPITVTHPEASRYFMTIEEAVRLVLQAGAYADSAGEVFVLDMGEPVKIIDLAQRLAAELRPGLAPEIVVTGLRPGEKLHEDLVSSSDEVLDRPHKLLIRCAVPVLDPADLAVLDEARSADQLTVKLRALAYRSPDAAVGGSARS